MSAQRPVIASSSKEGGADTSPLLPVQAEIQPKDATQPPTGGALPCPDPAALKPGIHARARWRRLSLVIWGLALGAALIYSTGVMMGNHGRGMASGPPLLPLAPGNRWAYQLNSTINFQQGPQGSASLEITGRDRGGYVFHSRMTARSRGLSKPHQDTDLFVMTQSAGKYYVAIGERGAHFSNMPMHLEPGTTWMVPGGITETVTNQERVTVPAGTFTAWRIVANWPLALPVPQRLIPEHSAGERWHAMWLVPGVGMVKEQFITLTKDGGALIIMLDLTSRRLVS